MTSKFSRHRNKPDRVKSLPNNICIVATSVGDILVNSPPETLKFLTANEIPPPQFILLPVDIPSGQHLGSSGFIRKGINYACVEFLLYKNFFFGGEKKTTLITSTDDQAQRLKVILEETLIGPTDLAEYDHFRWLKNECEVVSYLPSLNRSPNVEDMAEIISLESGGGNLGNVRIQLFDDQFVFSEHDAIIAVIPTEINETALPLTLPHPSEIKQGELTIQFVGASDGFDPYGITTCFLLYHGTTGENALTLFDTAAYLRIRLGNLGVSTRQISEVVVTHLHEDHLAGLPELLLMGETRSRILTTNTIYVSLLRVLSAMLAVPQEEVAALFDFYPLRPDQTLTVDGKPFDVIYSVHSIPTIAIRIGSFYYSGDMRYDEEWFEQLEAENVITADRRQKLTSFLKGADVIVHDAGEGAIHTTPSPAVLRQLSSKTKHLILAHTSKRKLQLPKEELLPTVVEIATSGSAISFGKTINQLDQAKILETISACPLYARLPFGTRIELSQETTLRQWQAGEIIIEYNQASNFNSYIVHDGLVEVWVDGIRKEVSGRGTSIGERSAITQQPRSATVIAQGDVTMLEIPLEKFQPISKTLGLQAAYDRAEWLWKHPTFEHLPWVTLLDLGLDFQPRKFRTGECIFEYGKTGHECYILISGKVMLIDKYLELIGELTAPGEFFGGRSVLFGTPRNASACVSADTEIWSLPAPALHRLKMTYPNVLLHLRIVEGSRHGHSPLISLVRPDTD